MSLVILNAFCDPFVSRMKRVQRRVPLGKDGTSSLSALDPRIRLRERGGRVSFGSIWNRIQMLMAKKSISLGASVESMP